MHVFLFLARAVKRQAVLALPSRPGLPTLLWRNDGGGLVMQYGARMANGLTIGDVIRLILDRWTE
jgi:hypothetical protein